MTERGGYHDATYSLDRRIVGVDDTDAKEPTLDNEFRILWRQELHRMLESRDEFTRAIAEKFLDKERAKEIVEQMEMGASDVSLHQEFKMLGILVVREAEARFDYHDPDSGIDIRSGDPYLDLHLPPVPLEYRTRDAVEASFALIAEYTQAHGLKPKYVMGFTGASLAGLAHRRFGFGLSLPDPGELPKDVLQGVENVYNQFGKELEPPAVVSMPTENFLSIYGKAEQPPAATTRRRSLGRLATTGEL